MKNEILPALIKKYEALKQDLADLEILHIAEYTALRDRYFLESQAKKWAIEKIRTRINEINRKE